MIALVLGGVVAVALGGLMLAGGGESGVETVHGVPVEVLDRVIARVSRHEGTFDSMNLNGSGAGMEFGILQWSQRPGQLGVLLTAMAQADPERFVATFGPHSRELLAATRTASMGPVGEAVLWKEPWVSRFRAAGRDPVWQQVQVALARGGEHMRGAVEAWKVLGVADQRALALSFDTSVQQGPRFAVRLAREVAGRGIADTERRLWAYAEGGAAPFRRTTAPERPHPAPHIRWVRHGEREWRAWAGEVDLWAAVSGRRRRLLPLGGSQSSRQPTSKLGYAARHDRAGDR